MPNQGRITPKQIELARKILSIVPPKDNTRTREEAGEVLAKDFKLAFKKGYSPREIAAMLKAYGIIIPASVVAKYEGPETDKEIDVSRLLAASGKCSRKQVRAVSTKLLQNSPEDEKNPWDMDLDDWCGPAKINPANYGTFKIKPDTPKGEL